MLEAKVAEDQGALAEAVETAQEVAGYEPEEDEKVTATVIKKALKDLIDDLKGSAGAGTAKERKGLIDARDAITAVENRIKANKERLRELQFELDLKLTLKRIGAEDEQAESRGADPQHRGPGCRPEWEGPRRQEADRRAHQGQGRVAASASRAPIHSWPRSAVNSPSRRPRT